MRDNRFTALQRESINGKKHNFKPCTNEEFDKGFHYCFDWDGLFIAPNYGSEWDCCSCHPLKRKESK
jgi:hypothetical protein